MLADKEDGNHGSTNIGTIQGHSDADDMGGVEDWFVEDDGGVVWGAFFFNFFKII